MTIIFLLAVLSSADSAAKRRTPLVEVNPNELDFLNTVVLPINFALRFRYRGRTLVIRYNNELHFPGSKKYYLASFEEDSREGWNSSDYSSCIYDITHHHEFPQLFDEPGEQSLIIFRCQKDKCNVNDVGCKDDWKLVKIAVCIMVVLSFIVGLLCFRYQRMKNEEYKETNSPNESSL